MRRAMRHAHLLGAKDPLMHRLAPTLVGRDGRRPIRSCAAPSRSIVETLRQEEERFRRTLGRGMACSTRRPRVSATATCCSGETAFKLYDTYGFPLDLTQDAVRAKGLTVDTDGFDAAMARQRKMARESWAGSGQQAAGRRVARPARPARPHRSSSATSRPRPPASSWPWSRTAREVDARRGRARPSRRCSTARPSTPRAAARPATAARSTGRAAAPRCSTPRSRPATCTPTC